MTATGKSAAVRREADPIIEMQSAFEHAPESAPADSCDNTHAVTFPAVFLIAFPTGDQFKHHMHQDSHHQVLDVFVNTRAIHVHHFRHVAAALLFGACRGGACAVARSTVHGTGNQFAKVATRLAGATSAHASAARGDSGEDARCTD
jgi:hypothetical protein